MAEFQSDGCTLVPDGTWYACCLIHDWLYWWQPDGITKEMADWAMIECMTNLGVDGNIISIFSLGLTLFAWFFWLRGRRARPTEPQPYTLQRWVRRIKEHFNVE